MSDIVERLRMRPTGDPYLHMMVHEAADEIERLRAALGYLWRTQDPDAWEDEFVADVLKLLA